jgi:hypothetical protein
LDKLESNLCDPIDKFPERADIADSQIVLSAQRKQRHEHARNLFLRRKIQSWLRHLVMSSEVETSLILIVFSNGERFLDFASLRSK